jgi:hypothetical protein
MGTRSIVEGCRTHTRGGSRFPGRTWVAAMLCLAYLGACGPAELEEADEPLAQQSQELRAPNGLSYNGLSYNGLSYNGLSYNGLSYNGLSSADFQGWFNKDPEMADHVMGYVVRCAVPIGRWLTYKDPATRKTYRWAGLLGLAPRWASGAPPTPTEQQVITACLAAHTNMYQQHVAISVLGRDAERRIIPFSREELQVFSEREACFFGNLFTGEGIYVGTDRVPYDERESTSRSCSIPPSSGSHESLCSPMIHVGACASSCTLDAWGFYKSCTVDGVSYQPLTTRLRPTEIFRCGDGVCQISESCGTSTRFDSCASDCGSCP